MTKNRQRESVSVDNTGNYATGHTLQAASDLKEIGHAVRETIYDRTHQETATTDGLPGAQAAADHPHTGSQQGGRSGK
ncbi:MAG TPA: hypothetical protein VK191_11350 [Symbiobacteriaceae bacterium]|nr:hypothetical protein [Symbiobacteriaceae bacterium]